MRFFTSTSAVALLAVLAATAVHAQEAANISSASLLKDFSLLLNTPEGHAVLDQNLATAIATNSGASATDRQQAIHDNTIAALVGSLNNGQIVTDALGEKLSAAFDATNSLSPSYTATVFSAKFQDLMLQVNMLAQSDSAFAKNYYANGSTDGNPLHPALGISLPAGGQFNIYDKAYSPDPANANTVGNSRPVQVAPASIQTFTGTDYFGNSVNSATILPTLKTNASFPSGHTTFGFASTLMLAVMVPERFQELLTRGAEYGNSRVVLGAHYPLDVIGARIMALKAVAGMLNNDPAYTNRAYTTFLGQHLTSTGDFAALTADAGGDLRAMLESGCGSTIDDCIASSSTDRFSDAAKNAADYEYRLTYGMSPVSDTTLAAVVPDGAEVLIASRFAYLSAAQRREVLATTELASGSALDDGSGWARLNLYKAANGYGAFRDDVDVTMNKALGGFSASDVWSNDIGGEGGLTKRGDGKLELAGMNTYSGDTNVEAGELAISGQVAGKVKVGQHAALSGDGAILGDLTVNGLLSPGDDFGSLFVGGNLTMASTALYRVEIADTTPDLFDMVTVGGDLDLNDASLAVLLRNGFKFSKNQFFEILDLVGTRTGYFDGLGEGDRISRRGRDLFITYAGGDGNDIVLYTGDDPAPVPLPASLGLLLGGLGSLGALARRKRKAQA